MKEIENSNFEKFGFKETILKGLADMGFNIPSPIQVKAIPHIMEGHDIIGQAQTGTGKTAAFALPSLNNLAYNGNIEILVLVPTRELVTQVTEEFQKLGKYEKIQVVSIYGGQSYSVQFDKIRKGCEVVIATPGRLIDLLKNGNLKTLKPSTVILDEADEMLDMGFLEDIQKIFSLLPKEKRQTLFFSATMPPPIQKLANTILINPVTVSVINENNNKSNNNIKEYYVILRENERDDALIRLLDSEKKPKSIIFCKTKRDVDRVSTHLISKGYPAGGLHGDMEQPQRKKMIESFQENKISSLIATDVAARGLDIKDVTHVFNYHIPFEPESYVHRIGRTGRAGKFGKSITLVTVSEFHKLKRFKQFTGGEIASLIVPTLSELKEESGLQLLNEIKNIKINSSVGNFLKILKSEFSLEESLEKLMSYALSKIVVYGPEKIGLNKEELSEISDRPRRESRGRSGNNRGRDNRKRNYGKSGGSNSSGGGGGQRSNKPFSKIKIRKKK